MQLSRGCGEHGICPVPPTGTDLPGATHWNAPEQNAPVPPTVMPGTPIRVPPTGVAPESAVRFVKCLSRARCPVVRTLTPDVSEMQLRRGCGEQVCSVPPTGTDLPGATHWNARNRFRNTNACRCGPSGRRVSTGLVPADRLQRFR